MFLEKEDAGATGNISWLMFLICNKGKQLWEEQGV